MALPGRRGGQTWSVTILLQKATRGFRTTSISVGGLQQLGLKGLCLTDLVHL